METVRGLEEQLPTSKQRAIKLGYNLHVNRAKIWLRLVLPLAIHLVLTAGLLVFGVSQLQTCLKCRPNSPFECLNKIMDKESKSCASGSRTVRHCCWWGCLFVAVFPPAALPLLQHSNQSSYCARRCNTRQTGRLALRCRHHPGGAGVRADRLGARGGHREAGEREPGGEVEAAAVPRPQRQERVPPRGEGGGVVQCPEVLACYSCLCVSLRHACRGDQCKVIKDLRLLREELAKPVGWRRVVCGLLRPFAIIGSALFSIARYIFHCQWRVGAAQRAFNHARAVVGTDTRPGCCLPVAEPPPASTARKGPRVVVFIDDLDRVKPLQAPEVRLQTAGMLEYGVVCAAMLVFSANRAHIFTLHLDPSGCQPCAGRPGRRHHRCHRHGELFLWRPPCQCSRIDAGA